MESPIELLPEQYQNKKTEANQKIGPKSVII
jgi:hypothetical protein